MPSYWLNLRREQSIRIIAATLRFLLLSITHQITCCSPARLTGMFKQHGEIVERSTLVGRRCDPFNTRRSFKSQTG